jgi:hypothetical protein
MSKNWEIIEGIDFYNIQDADTLLSVARDITDKPTALLLAASPTLLSACERASEGYQIMMGILDRTMPGWRRDYNFHRGKVQIDEAIATAKGEQA